MKKQSNGSLIIEEVFRTKRQRDAKEVPFERDELVRAAKKLRLKVPKNLGGVIYSYRYGKEGHAARVHATAPKGWHWVLYGRGDAKYAFVLSRLSNIFPNPKLRAIEIADSTPGMVLEHRLNDEQALLAIVRYNRLIDIFTENTCYSLQNHLRTKISGVGQVETDEIYLGINSMGMKCVFPVQAKGKKDIMNVVQIHQDFGVGKSKFSGLKCRPIGVQFVPERKEIALFEFSMKKKDVIEIAKERHYKFRIKRTDDLNPETADHRDSEWDEEE